MDKKDFLKRLKDSLVEVGKDALGEAMEGESEAQAPREAEVERAAATGPSEGPGSNTAAVSSGIPISRRLGPSAIDGQAAGAGAPPLGAQPAGQKRSRGMVDGLLDGLVDQASQRLEYSARKALTQAFDERREDLEALAVTALTRSIREEGKTLEALIDRVVEVKKKEVRLSLLVLIFGSLLYLALRYFAA